MGLRSPDDRRNRSGGAKDTLDVATILWLAMGFAMIASLWFILRGAFKVFALGGFASISRDVLWMSPLGHAALFLCLALPVWVLTRVMPRRQGALLAAAVFAAATVHAALLPWTQIGIYAALIFAVGAGVTVGRQVVRIGDRVAGMARKVAMSLGSAFALGAVAVAGVRLFSGNHAAVTPAAGPNVLLIVFDTFRADALGTYGSTRGLTSAIDRFAAGGTVFDWAMSTSGWTLPSHASLFTGRYPQRVAVDFEHRLGAREPTLAEAFSAHGYETAGFAANLDYVSWESGLQRGFRTWTDFPVSWQTVIKSTLHGQTRLAEELLRARGWRERWRALKRRRLFVEPKPEPPAVLARDITNRFLGWHQEQTRPWFAFLNYFDPHKPYLADWRRVAGESPSDTLQAGYEAEIAYLDAHVGRLLDSLERRGAMRNTLVVITADHGEHFGEHNLQGHANSVYTTLLHVPLIIRWDGRVPAGHRVTRVVSHRDLPRTLAGLAGLTRARFPGHSLSDTWRDSLAQTSEVIAQHERVMDVDLARPASAAAMTTIFDGRWQLIRSLRRVIEEMYEYRHDPNAERNLIGSDSAMRMRDSLIERMRTALSADNADTTAPRGEIVMRER